MQKRISIFYVLILSALSVASHNAIRRNDVNMLILTSPELMTIADGYADWKRTMGFHVDIIADNWSDAVMVKNALDDIYNVKDIDYLLIVGNSTLVPAYRSTIYLNSGAYNGRFTYRSKNYTHSTDYFYSICPNDTNKRVKCGRIAVADSSAAITVFNKIKTFEENLPAPPDSSFYNTALHMAYYEDDAGPEKSLDDAIYYEDYRFVLTTEEIIDTLTMDTVNAISNFIRVYTGAETASSGNAHWNNTLYAQGGDVPASLNFHGTKQDVVDAINQGVLYAMYYDHGNADCWASANITKDDINNLSNRCKLPIVFCCCCNNFCGLSDNTFAEKFLENPDGGAAGVVASSDYIMTGLMDVFIERAFNAMWPHEDFYPILGVELQNRVETDSMICRPAEDRLGDVVMRGLSDMESYFKNTVLNTNSPQSNTQRTPQDFLKFIQHMKEIMHVVGDPSMKLYTGVPHEIAEPIVTYGNDSIYISLSDGEAIVTLFNNDTKEVFSIIGNHAVFPSSQDVLTLSIHRKSSNVWTSQVEDLYLQDELFTDSNTFSARSIYMGRHVTDETPTGNVVFVEGSQTQLFTNKLVLAPGTIIEKGATFTNR